MGLGQCQLCLESLFDSAIVREALPFKPDSDTFCEEGESKAAASAGESADSIRCLCTDVAINNVSPQEYASAKKCEDGFSAEMMERRTLGREGSEGDLSAASSGVDVNPAMAKRSH